MIIDLYLYCNIAFESIIEKKCSNAGFPEIDFFHTNIKSD